MPCALGVASLSALRPAALGLLSILVWESWPPARGGSAANGAAFGIPGYSTAPGSLLERSFVGMCIHQASVALGSSASRATVGANVVVTFDTTWLGAAGVGRENVPVSQPA